MNSMENQSKTTSKPGPLCSKRAVVNMENEGDLKIPKKRVLRPRYVAQFSLYMCTPKTRFSEVCCQTPFFH